MFIHNINPVFLTLGPIELRYYGLVYFFGFIIAYFLILKKHKELGLKKDQVDSFMLYIMICAIACARIFDFIIERPGVFIQDPLEILRVWNGGLSFFGGILGGLLGGFLFFRKDLDWKKKFFKISDMIMPLFALVLVFGRLANFINGELVGKITNVSWCVVFPAFDGCRHPYQIYAALSHLLLFGLMLFFTKYKLKKKLSDGFVTGWFVICYSAIRFLTDFWRQDPTFMGITQWQWVSLAILIFGIILLRNRTEKKTKKAKQT